MKAVLVTGSSGFIGKNLCAAISEIPDIEILRFDAEDQRSTLSRHAERADFVFHLAGVNRPTRAEEYYAGNFELTQYLLNSLAKTGRPVPVLLSSSIQATNDSDYGKSKRMAEEAIINYARTYGSACFVYRLHNVFGKWCRPDYNSVVATFCHNIAHGINIAISDPAKKLSLVYIDDVIRHFLACVQDQGPKEYQGKLLAVEPVYTISVGDLAARIRSFLAVRDGLMLPDVGDPLTRYLYATYLSYLDPESLSYEIPMKRDRRGWLAEVMKSESLGQLFVSRTKSDVIRGNHYHHTKAEKFCLIKGRAIIRLQSLLTDRHMAFEVADDRLEIVDIPPGYTHSITATSKEDAIVLFWASEPFDTDHPDTYARVVEP